MRRILPLMLLALAACTDAPLPTVPSADGAAAAQPVRLVDMKLTGDARTAALRFVQVVETVEPVAERECRARSWRLNCDFEIVVDDRPGQPPNAFQTVDASGRPIIAFNLALIASARNEDELAFVMGHEAAHHILDHLSKTAQSATVGAVVFSGIAALGGGDAQAVQAAEQLGATVGARTYSKDYELESDELGTVIAARAGYDPMRGAAFFTRIPDPGNRFLGSHPPNADRLETVRRTYARLMARGGA